MNTIIAYASQKGFIQEVAERIQKGLKGSAELVNLNKTKKADLTDADTVIISGAVHAGRISKKITAFCEKYAEELSDKRIAFVIGGLDEKGYQDAAAKNFPALIDQAWKTIHAGGRYVPAEHNFLVRYIMTKISKSSDPVFVERWDQVDQLIKELEEA